MEYNPPGHGFQKSLLNNKDVQNDRGVSGSENDEDKSEKESKLKHESTDFEDTEIKETTGHRVLGSYAPDSPTTDLRGKHEYIWKTQEPHGHSGILKYEDFTPPEERLYLEKRVRCKLCPPRKDRKTREQCSSCQRPMCDQHRAFICVDCTGAD